MRVLVIDDEAPARELLTDMLGRHPDVEVVGEADDVESAARLCATHCPQALFLDIEMGGSNGFALLEKLEGTPPAVVFVTAHAQFAVTAFNVCAVDYLLKPVCAERLAQSVEKLRQHLASPHVAGTIHLATQHGIEVVEIHSITHIQADENYTHVFFNEGRSLHVRKSLQSWEQALPSAEFVRIHRSLLVNTAAIRRIGLDSRDNGRLYLKGHNQPLTLARRALQRLRQLLPQ